MAIHHTVYLGLGANLGDRQHNLAQALQYLRSRVTIERVSACYETEPVGYLDQPNFLNITCSGSTELPADELLGFLKQVEMQMGREVSFRNAPRPIDIDILFYDDLVTTSENLVIPHPRLHERGFVLVPLAEIAPSFVHPALGASVAEMLARLDHTGIVAVLQGVSLLASRDVQEMLPTVRLGLTRVGVTGLRRIIRIVRDGVDNPFYAEIDLFADLDRNQTGVHMSRFSDVLEETADEMALQKAPDIETLAERVTREIVVRQDANRAEARVRATFPMEKAAPLSGRRTQELYSLLGIAVSTRRSSRRAVGVEADAMTVCPSAQDMVREHSRQLLIEQGFTPEQADRALAAIPIASHNQRGRGTLMIGSAEPIRAEDLVEIVESSMSSETYGRLKRPDEYFIVNKAHRNPRSVEDVVRQMLANVIERYRDLPETAFVSARHVSYEGIHKHNTFAERYGTLGEFRGEMEDGRYLARHTTMEEWLEG